MKTRYATTYRRLIHSWADNIISLLDVFAAFLQTRLAPAVNGVTRRFPRIAEFFKNLTPKKLFAFLCMVSVLSQIDFLSEVWLIRAAVILLWFMAFLFFAAKSRLKLQRETLFFLCPILIFDLLTFLTGLVKGNLSGYLCSPITYSANLSAFVFLTGSLAGAVSEKKLILTGAKVYVLCAIFISIYTIITSFSGIWLSAETYVYSRKNSLAPIILTAVCCIMFLKIIKNVKLNTLLLVLFIGFMVLLKSRASIIGLAAALVVWYVCVIKNRRKRLYIIIAVLLAVLLVLVIPALRELVIGNIIFNNRASLGVNEITSGRSEQFTLIFLANFPNAPFFGSGSTYIESLPLAALLSFGIVSALPLLIFAAVPLRTATLFKNGPVPQSYVLFLKAASIAFLINCLFEERAPFGPGITYFFLWFTSGFFIGCKKNLSVSIR